VDFKSFITFEPGNRQRPSSEFHERKRLRVESDSPVGHHFCQKIKFVVCVFLAVFIINDLLTQ
jgi:hypothetical protein